MKPLEVIVMLVVDATLIGGLYVGYFHSEDTLYSVVIIAMWMLTLQAFITMHTLLSHSKSTSVTLKRLKVANEYWDTLDKQGGVERIYDDVTDVASVLLLWIAGAPVLAVAYGIATVFKAYSRTQGARQRVLSQAGEAHEP